MQEILRLPNKGDGPRCRLVTVRVRRGIQAYWKDHTKMAHRRIAHRKDHKDSLPKGSHRTSLDPHVGGKYKESERSWIPRGKVRSVSNFS